MNLHILIAEPDGTVKVRAEGADAEFSRDFGQRGNESGSSPALTQFEAGGTERCLQASL